MKANRVLSSKILRDIDVVRTSVWDIKEIEGIYTILDVELMEVEEKKDALIYLRKGNYYFTILASEFMQSIVVKHINLFDHKNYERLMDSCSIHDDYQLPEKIQVIGKHEIKKHGEDEMKQMLILKDI